jgi:hypothetical protein
MLAACVNIPEEDLAPPKILQEQESGPVAEPAERIPEPVHNQSPEEPKTAAVKPKATVVNSTPSAQQQSQYAWSTEPLSIGEGETKVIYIKQ